ncbi:MAG: drug/metabolite transporter (DMT)-like permease [Verrucomicrobiales bacterium]|jgi:drug/metabolite transporter (DMT)-like permease
MAGQKLGAASSDPNAARMKAFLLVGIAYLVIAVVIPIVLLLLKGESLKMTPAGIKWGGLAGFLGAIGALGVILAMTSGGHPVVVMSLIFGGAPLVNAIYASVFIHPPANGWASVRWEFILGIILVAAGGVLVTKFKPESPKKGDHGKPAAIAESAAADS